MPVADPTRIIVDLDLAPSELITKYIISKSRCQLFCFPGSMANAESSLGYTQYATMIVFLFPDCVWPVAPIVLENRKYYKYVVD